MKYLFLFLLLGLLSCGDDATGDTTRDATGDASKRKSKQEKKYSEEDIIRNFDTDWEDGYMIQTETVYFKKDMTLFTGFLSEVQSNGYRKEKNYKNGKLDGLIKSWFASGEIAEEGDSKIYRYKKGYKEGLGIGFTPDHLGWRSLGIEFIDNIPYIIYVDGGGASQTVIMRKIVFDINQNIDLIQIFKATVTFGGGGIDCVSGDCDYKGYLSSKYPDEY